MPKLCSTGTVEPLKKNHISCKTLTIEIIYYFVIFAFMLKLMIFLYKYKKYACVERMNEELIQVFFFHLTLQLGSNYYSGSSPDYPDSCSRHFQDEC